MRKTITFLVAAVLVLATQFAMADPISATNNHSGISVGSGTNTLLQNLLNRIYACNNCIDAANGQQQAGVRGLGAVPAVMSPQLQFEYTSNKNAFGIWNMTGSNLSPRAVQMFSPSATGQKDASVTVVQLSTPASGTDWILSGRPTTFPPIPYDQFWFDTTGNGQTYYSANQLNRNRGTQMLAQQPFAQERWASAFKQAGMGSGSGTDFSGMVASLQSILPVPEPLAMLLLGTGLVCTAALLRRRYRALKLN